MSGTLGNCFKASCSSPLRIRLMYQVDLRRTSLRVMLTLQDEDFALAKLMQEQERAFFHARNLYGYG